MCMCLCAVVHMCLVVYVRHLVKFELLPAANEAKTNCLCDPLIFVTSELAERVNNDTENNVKKNDQNK